MGYNTWNAFGTRITEDLIKETADLMVSLGLVAAGYRYLNLDDGWPEMQRLPNKSLQAHTTKFPSGIPALVRYVQAWGMQLGLYTDEGVLTCARYPGSQGYEDIDAATFAEWGVAYLKVDNCWADPLSVVRRYLAMGRALNASCPGLVYSICSWGVGSPWLGWGREVGGHTWRTSQDIRAEWSSVLHCLDSVKGLAQYAGPGGWNDPDMLEVGNGGLSLGMQRAHFALWCLVKSPLLIGADLRQLASSTAGKQSLGVLLAHEVIAVNQDDLGVAGDLLWSAPPGEPRVQIWGGPLSGGARAVVVVNRDAPSAVAVEGAGEGLGAQGLRGADVSVPWSLLGLPDDTQVTVRDLYARSDLASGVVGQYTVTVGPADCVALRLTPEASPSVGVASHREWVGQLEAWRPWHTAVPTEQDVGNAATEVV